MREFEDRNGDTWIATVAERGGPDFKGRFHLVLAPEDETDEEVELLDIRWNSRHTAERTLETMSDTELRRRLRSARGRKGSAFRPPVPSGDS